MREDREVELRTFRRFKVEMWVDKVGREAFSTRRLDSLPIIDVLVKRRTLLVKWQISDFSSFSQNR